MIITSVIMILVALLLLGILSLVFGTAVGIIGLVFKVVFGILGAVFKLVFSPAILIALVIVLVIFLL